MRGRSLVLCVPFVLAAAKARPCGLSPPIGPNGLPAVCRGESSSVQVRASLSAGGTRTQIDFSGRRAPLVQGAVLLGVDVGFLDRLTATASAGSAVSGRVELDGVSYALRPGWVGGVAIAGRVLDGRGAAPFVHVSIAYSWAVSQSRAPDGAEATFTSKDWRVGLVVGKAFGGVAPFVAARGFGAGTDWAPGGGKGSDIHRFHLAAGAAAALGPRYDVLAEVAFLGEQRLSLGVGATL